MITFTKSHNKFYMAFSIILLIVTFANGNQKEKDALKQIHKLSLLSSYFDPEFGQVVREIKGSLTRVILDEDNTFYELEITDMNNVFKNPESKLRALKNQPFFAKVTQSKKQEIPLSIEITNGGLDPNDGLTTQYRTAYMILEMMFLTSAKEDFSVSINSSDSVKSPINLNITLPEKINIGGTGAVSVVGLRSSMSPMKFAVVPRINNKKIEGWEFDGFRCDKLNINYFYRFLDKEADMVTHAINIEATLKEKMDGNNYYQKIKTIDDPNQFQMYYLHELQISNVQ